MPNADETRCRFKSWTRRASTCRNWEVVAGLEIPSHLLRRELDEGAELRKSGAPAWIVERKPRDLDAIWIQHGLQLPLLEVVHDDGTGQAKKPDAPQCRTNAGLDVVDDQRTFDADRDRLTIDGKLPAIDHPRRLPKEDAAEIL
jgi:hypothetical protein